jgi:hypothetical protein
MGEGRSDCTGEGVVERKEKVFVLSLLKKGF